MVFVCLFFFVTVAIRLSTTALSKRHERALKAQGAIEYDPQTSQMLGVAHFAFYGAGFIEALISPGEVDAISLFGIALWVTSMGVLWSVIQTLGPLWTVKIIIAPHHELRQTGFFSFVRHPNYFLNIIPELIGYACALHSWYTLCLGLPLYGLILAKRIRVEEHVMRNAFPAY
jgi:isoprenylcysteine carboxyl methyltransferase (ICMT) family protein YpbQ